MGSVVYSGVDQFSISNVNPATIASTPFSFVGNGTNINLTDTRSNTNMSVIGQYLGVLTNAQLASITNAGLIIFFYYENSGSNSIQPYFNPNYLNATTYAQGVTDANNAKAYLSDLGITGNQAVYFAIDYDPTTSQQFTALAQYFGGVMSVMGSAYTGVYAGGGAYENLLLYLANTPYPNPSYFAQSRSFGFYGNSTLNANAQIWQFPGYYGGYAPQYSTNPQTQYPYGTETYGDPGYVYFPNGSSYLDFDPLFVVNSNFGGYGTVTPPPPPTPGVTNSFQTILQNVTPTLESQVNIITPENKYDRIIYSNTFFGSVTSSTWPVFAFTNNIDTGLGQSGYPIGNFAYSTTGPVTFNPNTLFAQWTDFGVIYAVSNSTSLGALPEVVIQAVSYDDGTVNFYVDQPIPPSGSSTVYFYINLSILAKDNALSINSNTTQLTESSAYGNFLPYATSLPSTFRRIYNDFTVGVGAAGSFFHNQTTIPDFLVFVYDGTSWFNIAPAMTDSTYSTSDIYVYCDSTKIYYYIGSGNGATSAVIRVYKDN